MEGNDALEADLMPALRNNAYAEKRKRQRSPVTRASLSLDGENFSIGTPDRFGRTSIAVEKLIL